ncbi:fungal-specific transcription factor domain-containing protein [Myxozyma melibiosi]|uniref:Fungal-specific transcription factor domain-containing protein n=1 Tax=Myxozyma melibiosi TaxID=54550 RepID=A0ABR1F4Y3_9ASCO
MSVSNSPLMSVARLLSSTDDSRQNPGHASPAGPAAHFRPEIGNATASAPVDGITSSIGTAHHQQHQHHLHHQELQRQEDFKNSSETAAEPQPPVRKKRKKVRKKVDPDKRKRIAVACESCKRRKQKCDGAQPCTICDQKGFECIYTREVRNQQPTTPSSSSTTNNEPKPPPPPPAPPSEQQKALLGLAMKLVSKPTPAAADDDTITATPDHHHPHYDSSAHSGLNVLGDVAAMAATQSDKTSSPAAPTLYPANSGTPASTNTTLTTTATSTPASAQKPANEGSPSHAEAEQNAGATKSANLHDYQVETVGSGHSRMLCDPQGHLRYIGESGALSFLEQTRSVFRKTIGESNFTLDPDRFRFVDGPSHVASIVPIRPPPREMAEMLIQLFLDNVQPLNYVFDLEVFMEQVDLIYKNPMRCSNNWLCLLYLTCAIGGIFANSKKLLDLRREKATDSSSTAAPDSAASPSSSAFAAAAASKLEESDSIPSKEFFESGLGLMKDAAEDGEIWVVQAYLLCCLYYMFICKRNVSWVHLGTTIRLAQALGLHRQVLNTQYPKRERLLRERLWRTVYVLDRYCSSSLGRPMMIENSDFVDSFAANNNNSSSTDFFDQVQSEQAKIMTIVGDVCKFVYGKQSISSSASQELAMRLRQWSSELPKHMQLSSSSSLSSTAAPTATAAASATRDDTEKQSVSDGAGARLEMEVPHMQSRSVRPTLTKKRKMRQMLLRMHLCHLNGIILLTRPFFFFYVVRNSVENDANVSLNKAVTRLSSACVLCAARSVDLVMALFIENEQPTRPPFLIYFIFSAGLILVLEAFRQKSSVESYIMRGISLCMFILDYYATCDSSSARYKQILVEMDRAVRTAYSSETGTSSHLGQMEQINQLLFSSSGASSGRNTAGTTTPQDAHRRPPFAAAVTGVGVSASTGLSREGSVLDVNEGSAARRQEEDLWYREFTRRGGDFGAGFGSASGGGGGGAGGGDGSSTPTSSNLSAMFLRAAASNGMYQQQQQAVNISQTPVLAPVPIPPQPAQQIPPITGYIPAEQQVVELSPSEAMEQFLMEDTFANTTTSVDFMYDLGIDWLNAAVSTADVLSGEPSHLDMAAEDGGGGGGGGGVRGLMLNSEF